MTSEIRANTLKNRVGLGTVSFTNTGPVVSGIVTANTLRLPDATSGSLGRVQLGNGLHLNLYHDGSNSFLVNNNGYLSIQSQAGVNGIFIARNAEVNLYYGPSVRLQTSPSGVTINRDLDVDGHTELDNGNVSGVVTFTSAPNAIQMNDGARVSFGTSLKTSISYNTSSSRTIIRNYNDTLEIGYRSTELHYINQARLTISSSNNFSADAPTTFSGDNYNAGWFPSSNGGTFKINDNARLAFGSNGDTNFFHNNAHFYLQNTTGNINVTGNVVLNNDISVDGHTNLDNVSIAGVTTTTDNIDIDADNKKLQIGASQDLQLFHDGGHSRITNTTGILKLTAPAGQSVRVVPPDDSGNVAVFHIDGSTHLYYDSAHKFSTISDGIEVVGNMSIMDSIYHRSDDNTKIRFPANDTVTVETSGSERLRIGPNGHVSIGKNSTSTTGPGLIVQKYSELANSRMNINDGNYFMAPAGRMCVSFGYPADGEDLWVGWQGAYTATSGSCGILFSPTHGNTGQQSGMYIRGEATASSVSHLSFGKVMGGSNVSTKATLEEYVRIDAGGGMQLGTSTATASKLTVYGANDAAAIFQGSGTGTGAANGFLVGNNGGTDGLLWNYENGNTKIATNNVERLRITSEGYIHLGNTAHGTNRVGGQAITGQDLDAVVKLYSSNSNLWLAQLRADNATTSGVFMRAGNSSSTYTLYATGYDENNPHLIVRGDGAVLIGESSQSGMQRGDVIVHASIQSGNVNEPSVIHRNSTGAIIYFEHYFYCNKGGAGNSHTVNQDIIQIQNIGNFHQAVFHCWMGVRLQGQGDNYTRPATWQTGVNRFNGGSTIQKEENWISADSAVQTYANLHIGNANSTSYYLRMNWPAGTYGSSFAGGKITASFLGCDVANSNITFAYGRT